MDQDRGTNETLANTVCTSVNAVYFEGKYLQERAAVNSSNKWNKTNTTVKGLLICTLLHLSTGKLVTVFPLPPTRANMPHPVANME